MALPLRAQEQGPCQGSLSTSSPSAPALAKYTPAAERSGIVFHHWLDAIRVPPRAHLVLENTNPHPVAVRFQAELRGDAGSTPTPPRCVWIRAHEFVRAEPGLTVFDYRGTRLSQVLIAAAEIAPLERPAPVADAVPPPARARPRPPRRTPPARPRAHTPRAQVPAREPVRPERRTTAAVAQDTPRSAAHETSRATVPLKIVRIDTLPVAPPREAPARVALAPPSSPRRPNRPPLARTANTTMRVAAAMVLVPAGVVLGIAVAGAATLLGGIVPFGALRRRRR